MSECRDNSIKIAVEPEGCEVCTFEETLIPGKCGHVVCGYCVAAAGVRCPKCVRVTHQGSMEIIEGEQPVYLSWKMEDQKLVIEVADNRECLRYRLRIPAPGSGKDPLLEVLS